jgi:hypothetical protein
LTEKLFRRGMIHGAARERVLQALRVPDAQADYRTWNGLEPRWEQEGPLVIAAAVKVAQALRADGVIDATVDDWLVRAVEDPLPEVRQVMWDSESAD